MAPTRAMSRRVARSSCARLSTLSKRVAMVLALAAVRRGRQGAAEGIKRRSGAQLPASHSWRWRPARGSVRPR